MRTMFSVDFYSMNTHLTFAILLPPQLDPSFAHVYQTLRTLARCLRQPHFRDIIQNRLRSVRRKSIEGPVRKIRKLLAGPFRDLVEELLHNDLQGDALEEWAHRTRDKWREVLVQKASKNRPQHYSDICDLDHFRTMALYRQWDAEAQILEDENLYMKLGVLRRLLVGGLLTEERDSRHRKDLRQPKCQCGAEPTVWHISWYCPLFENARKHILDVVKPEDLPMCTRYSALIPIRLQLSDTAIYVLCKVGSLIYGNNILEATKTVKMQQRSLQCNNLQHRTVRMTKMVTTFVHDPMVNQELFAVNAENMSRDISISS